MPRSRHRKGRSGRARRASDKSPSRRKGSRNTTKLVVWVIIAALALATGIYLIGQLGGSGTTGSLPGNEVTTESGLRYVDQVEGTGESPKPGQRVRVHYVGTLEDGTKFDSSRDSGKPLDFAIGTGSVIRGWDEGVMTMKVGGTRKLIVPSNLGYGPSGRPPKIPPNATLVFEVELLSIN